jgi:hypothetical protein
MTPDEVDTIIRHLASAIEHQRTINEDMRQFMAAQVQINDRLEITLQAIKDILNRGNGR